MSEDWAAVKTRLAEAKSYILTMFGPVPVMVIRASDRDAALARIEEQDRRIAELEAAQSDCVKLGQFIGDKLDSGRTAYLEAEVQSCHAELATALAGQQQAEARVAELEAEVLEQRDLKHEWSRAAGDAACALREEQKRAIEAEAEVESLKLIKEGAMRLQSALAAARGKVEKLEAEVEAEVGRLKGHAHLVDEERRNLRGDLADHKSALDAERGKVERLRGATGALLEAIGALLKMLLNSGSAPATATGIAVGAALLDQARRAAEDMRAALAATAP